MKQYIQILRPKQWLKNIFVFAPVFFNNNLLNTAYFLPTIVVCVAFCLISSSIYCINDIKDAEADRKHPKKCTRPVASGILSPKCAITISLICTLMSFGIISLVPSTNTTWLYVIILTYWIINLSYCIKLKQYAIIDIFCIATGFVLRVLIGGIATGIWISQWLVLLTFLIALFLALTKRYDDFCIFEKTGTAPRKSICRYNSTFIILSIAIVASVTIVCYIMYTMSEAVILRLETEYLYLTSVWVIAGLLRFVQNMIVYERSSSPTKQLINDHFLHLCIVGWLFSFVIIIYL